VKRKKKEHETARTEDETENDAPDDEVEGGGCACRQKGWWKRGDVEAKLNTVNMTAWLHNVAVRVSNVKGRCVVVVFQRVQGFVDFRPVGSEQLDQVRVQ